MFSEGLVLTFIQTVISKAQDKKNVYLMCNARSFGLWSSLCVMIDMVNCEQLIEGGYNEPVDHLCTR